MAALGLDPAATAGPTAQAIAGSVEEAVTAALSAGNVTKLDGEAGCRQGREGGRAQSGCCSACWRACWRVPCMLAWGWWVGARSLPAGLPTATKQTPSHCQTHPQARCCSHLPAKAPLTPRLAHRCHRPAAAGAAAAPASDSDSGLLGGLSQLFMGAGALSTQPAAVSRLVTVEALPDGAPCPALCRAVLSCTALRCAGLLGVSASKQQALAYSLAGACIASTAASQTAGLGRWMGLRLILRHLSPLLPSMCRHCSVLGHRSARQRLRPGRGQQRARLHARRRPHQPHHVCPHVWRPPAAHQVHQQHCSPPGGACW